MNLYQDEYLPADADVDTVIARGDERELTAIWHTYHRIQLERDILAGIRDDDMPAHEGSALTGAELRRIFTDQLAAIAEITPAQALEANRRLVQLLTGRRWWVIRDAREAGDSWTAVGAALEMTEHDARDWYAHKIQLQEQYVGKSHDAARARAVLDD
jgi:hypothetical protein